jgi:DNA-binding beta-propeller fold protein YncE
MRKNVITAAMFFAMGVGMIACSNETESIKLANENPATFAEISQIDLGNEGASEITAYDSQTQRLFVVNNDGGARIDVIDLKDVKLPKKLQSIDMAAMGGAANSVAVHGGRLAIGLEMANKQANGKVLIYNTTTLALIKEVTVGALPDMVTFSPDGNFILSANEGEPNDTYTSDPIGSVSIIATNQNYAVKTLDFSGFAGALSSLSSKGFRVTGLNADMSKDVEPEYITVSEDNKTAWVSLQENNGIARIDLTSQTITGIFPLGTKDFTLAQNFIDASDRDTKIELRTASVKGFFQPDAIASFTINNIPYIISANEGDARAYTAFNEELRTKDAKLDATLFPNTATLKLDANLGRLKLTAANGDTDKDGDYDELYTFGARSFAIWNGATGALVYDSGKELEEKTIAAGLYDDTRSDDKGVEPEGVTVATINNKKIAFVGLERADAVLVYDVTNPMMPIFLQLLKTGDAPEDVLFVKATDSPNKKSMLIVSSETDGLVKIYQPETL